MAKKIELNSGIRGKEGLPSINYFSNWNATFLRICLGSNLVKVIHSKCPICPNKLDGILGVRLVGSNMAKMGLQSWTTGD